MAAGLGFKTFTTGEVLTAADVNGYLMQGVLVFASAAARNAAITSPQEGQFAFTKDTNGLWYYDGAAWVASGATGDIEGVTAGVGISGGGTSGTVTVTNDMATTITASGDIVVGTGSGTYDNLPIGTTAQVLTADTTVSPYKVKWATPASGSMTLLSTTSTTTGSSYTVSSISSSYLNLYIIWDGLSCTAGSVITFAPAGGSASMAGVNQDPAFIVANAATARLMPDTQASGNAIACTIYNYASANPKPLAVSFGGVSAGWRGGGYLGFHSSAAISSLTFAISAGSFSAGTLKIYGVN